MEKISGKGVTERNFPGVKHVTGEPVAVAIKGISGDRTSEVLEMHPDLVGPPGARTTLDQAPPLAAFQDAEFCHGISSTSVFDHRHFFPVNHMAADGSIHNSKGTTRCALHQGEINLCDFPPRKLSGKSHVRGICFCDKEATTGFLVKPVDNARTGRVGR